MLPLFDLEGHVILITGGAGLIGREYARALTEAGAMAVLADLDINRANHVAEELGSDLILPLRLDVTDPESVQSGTRQIIERFGRIDGLVNNAAMDPKFDPEHAGEHGLTFENYPLDMWRKELDVNVTGLFLCTQQVVPQMLKQKRGVIVNISSIYGMVGPDQRLYESDDPSAPVMKKPVTYTVSKSAVFGFTKYLASYYGGTGIRANTLTLGGVYNRHEASFLKRYCRRAPLGRMAESEEYCGALIYLLSDASSYMTGANLVVDGGWTAW